MWVLFVIDVIVNTHAKDEVKYTRYAEYVTELECVEEAINLYREFTQGENASCQFFMRK